MSPPVGAASGGGDGAVGAGDGPRVLCVSGDSGSGKTGLLRRLVARLTVAPDRIGLVKHTHHAIDWHPGGKDSARLWEVGPGALCVAGPDQTALFLRRPGAACGPDDGGDGAPGTPGDPPDGEDVAAAATRRLVESCRRMPAGTRLVLAEGFRAARAPKIWTATGPPGPHPPAPGVRAVVVPAGQAAAWEEARPGIEIWRRGEAGRLADRIPGWAAPVSGLPTG